MAEEKTEVPKGYRIEEVPSSYQKVIVKGEEIINVDELIVKMANALEQAGLMK